MTSIQTCHFRDRTITNLTYPPVSDGIVEKLEDKYMVIYSPQSKLKVEMALRIKDTFERTAVYHFLHLKGFDR